MEAWFLNIQRPYTRAFFLSESRRCVIPVVCDELRLACSLTQLCQYDIFLLTFLVQLHVSAFIGHRQVVLRQLNAFY